MAAKADEDRHSVRVAHGLVDNIKDFSATKISSFGIFDGHNGSKAATYCAENLNNKVENAYNGLYKKTVDTFGETALADSDIDDGLMCQAIRASIASVNEKILKDNVSGTTSVTLYFKKSLATNSIRMYCANVGDSRAVMYTTVNLTDNTLVQQDSSAPSSHDFPDHSTHSLGSDSGNGSITSSGYSGHNNHYDLSNAMMIDDNFVPNNIVLQSSLQHNEFDEPLTIYKGVSDSSSKLSLKGLTSTPNFGLSNITPPGTPSASGHDKASSNSKAKKRGKFYNNFVVLGHLISEDHKLQLQRERSRIETKGKITEYLLPADASIIHSPIAAKGMSLRNYVVHDKSGDVVGCGMSLQEPRVNSLISSNCAETISLLSDFSIFESNNYPDSARLRKAESLLESVVSKAEFEEAISNSSSKETIDAVSTSEPEPVMQVVHDDSFIMRRKLVTEAGVIMGPEALCGRHNLSIMMTRSIGDKYGPRSCVAIPDISAFTLPSEQHTRFVLASDGFWDVVAVEAVRVLVMSNKFKDSRELATHLTRKAARRRIKQNLRMDDISVLVVDYNIDKFIPINGGGKITRKNFNINKGAAADSDDFMDKCLLGTEFCSIS